MLIDSVCISLGGSWSSCKLHLENHIHVRLELRCSLFLLLGPPLSENMTQMQQWHLDLVKPTAARAVRARPSLTKFSPPREAPWAPNGVTPPTRPRWAQSVLALPRMTQSWRCIRGPVHAGTVWMTHLGLTVMKNPSPCHPGAGASRLPPSQPQQSRPRQNDLECPRIQGAGPASREHLRPSRGRWTTPFGSSTAAVPAQVIHSLLRLSWKLNLQCVSVTPKRWHSQPC